MAEIKFTEIRPAERVASTEQSLRNMDGKWVVTLARGECRSGGYDIELVEANEENGVLTLVYETYDPDPGSFVTMALTYPTRKYVLHLQEEPKKVIYQCG